MALEYALPLDLVEEFKCFSCENYLSVFPVYLKNDGIGAICGRCVPSNQNDFIRDAAYETVAEFIQFPCSYKKNGCDEQLAPDALQKHELTECLFRLYRCPSEANTKCKWLGGYSDLVKHFKESHPNLLLKDLEFQISFDTSSKENLLLCFQNNLFVVKKDLDARKESFSCSVERLVGPETASNRYNYVIKFFNSDKDVWCKVTKKSTELEEYITVSKDYIKKKLIDPSLVYVQIGIVQVDESKTVEVECSQNSTDVKKNTDLNWEILNELECPVCLDFMHPPIFQCINGHSICHVCKPSMKKCPLCAVKIEDTRNFSLEKLTRFMSYPCKYYKNGCNYISKSVEIENHQESCEFGPFECPLKHYEMCQTVMFKSGVIQHVEEKHSSYIVKSNRISAPFKLDESKQIVYLVKHDDAIFLVRYMYMNTNRKFYWAAQFVGPAEGCGKFKFDIDIIDHSQRKLRCYVTGCCMPIQEQVNFEKSGNFVVLTYEQLQNMIGTTLEYNINILED